ncbi:MAG: S8 family serine peptidase, partial [Gemmatimonadota bacterium]
MPGGNINYSATFTGTSAAAPQVAAAAALILSREPNLTEFQVRSRLCQTAHSWGT